MKRIDVEGFTSLTVSTDHPSLCVYGAEGTGKTRLLCSAPGPIGVIALDRKTRGTIELLTEKLADTVQILTPKTNYITHNDSLRMMMHDVDNADDKTKKLREDTAKSIYANAINKVTEDLEKLIRAGAETVAIDTISDYCEWMLYAKFGRTSQIPAISRSSLVETVRTSLDAMKGQNILLIAREREIYRDKRDKNGEIEYKNGVKQAEGTGVFKPDWFSKLGHTVNAQVRLVSEVLEGTPAEKFGTWVYKCQLKSELEGRSLNTAGLRGEKITWDALVGCLGL